MDELYQTQLLELARDARKASPLFSATHEASVNNPTCGDKITLSLMIDKNVITDVSVSVEGCALCEAGAGFLLNHATGKSLTEITALGDALEAFLQTENKAQKSPFSTFLPIRAVKNRHKCVLLAFQASSSLQPLS